MSNLPDFSDHDYQIVRELGQNRSGGRITYLATQTPTQESVAIKQFQFARSGSDWSGYDSYDREIRVLQELNHPGIPKYLDSFETEDGFCLVQEYKPATSLTDDRTFSPAEIKRIAIALLEILVYLQDRFPPVIHRDIKPENILVGEADESGHRPVYLVDFGFARIGDGEVAVSSIVKGTLGFMPPEQLFNRQLTEASDLYGVGASLICLLTQTKSIDIGDLIDSNYRIEFKHLVPKLSLPWIAWLEKLVQPNLERRYSNATEALAALKPIYVTRSPSLKAHPETLEFQATKLGEKMTQTLTIRNTIAQTLLSGRWEIAPHPSDGTEEAETHPWISIQPPQFEANRALCKVTVRTGKLRADRTYDRQLILHANTPESTHTIALKVQTASIPLTTLKPPARKLAALLGSAFVLSFGFEVWWHASAGMAEWIVTLIDRIWSL
ncbi:MAG: serine/threonine-protein kinase [Cyanobacteriota bacterium]|nr:serine/threonine-protein kinase [Cyanobacteriota bacterium]